MNMTAYVLHVLLAFAAVALLVVPGLFLELVANTRDVPFIRKTFGLMSFHGKIGGPLALLLLPVGLWLALAYAIPLTSGWLIVSYAIYVVLVAIGLGYHSRRERTIGMLAVKSPDSAPSPELAAVLGDRLAWPMMLASVALWLVVIWLMVAKPF